jgi:site-specific recombinase XerD
MRASGFAVILPHAHTEASLLISSGMDIETVKDRLGHAQACTTMNVYGHAYKQNDVRLLRF